MTAYLVNLSVSNKTTIVSRSGERTTGTDYASEGGLRAHLVLCPDEDDRELDGLGFVHLHIEAQPETLDAMTPEQTLKWLRKALVRML